MRRRETAADLTATALALDAIDRGGKALAENDPASALRWLDRARRLLPEDPVAALMLAGARLPADPAAAAALFAEVAERHDLRQAWIGLAAARLRLQDPQSAADAIAALLSRHAFAPDASALATRIAGAAGWCALHPDGRLELHPAAPGRLRITLDGRPLTGKRLPSGWSSARAVVVRRDGMDLIGSPIRIDAIRRMAGCVELHEDGMTGWAWHPNDPDTAPVLTLSDPAGQPGQTFVATDESAKVAGTGPLSRPRTFHLSRQDLEHITGPVHIRGPDGKDLPGSPLDLSAVRDASPMAALVRGRAHRLNKATPVHPQAATDQVLPADAAMPPRPIGADAGRRATTVVILVHDGGAVVLACLRSVQASLPPDARILVIDDGSTDPVLTSVLDSLARRGRIALLRHPRAIGFPAAANAGIRAARGCDVVLLNSDTLVPPGWLQRLRAAAYAAPDIGTVTPLSNDASIVSYPSPAGTNPRPDQAQTNRLDRLANRANGGALVDIPVGVGFCLYLRRDCLNAVGPLRADVFAQGYGEENDLCLRARRLGWRSVALTGLFVGHHGGSSFGASATHLRRRNSLILERLHPGYHALIDRFLAGGTLAEPRRRIDLLAWRQRRRAWRTAAILITHDDGGGVEQRLAHAVNAHAEAGRRPIILRPARAASAVTVHDGLSDDLPNLVFSIPQELPALLRLLRNAGADRIEAHHLAGYPAAIYDLIARLALPYDVHVHDYAWVCPRIAMVAAHNRYCGEPELHGCEACIAGNGHYLREDITVAALRRRSAGFLRKARQVIVPADDVATRLRRYVPGLSPTTAPHEDDTRVMTPRSGNPRRPDIAGSTVCVVGAIGIHKGYEVLLACARDARRRGLDLDFVIVGHTIDDASMLETGRVFITGGYHPAEAVELIARQNAGFGFVPSVCPETWCLGLSDLWRAGLNAAAFDIGAPAERLRRTGRGIVLPLGLPPDAVNDALIRTIKTAKH